MQGLIGDARRAGYGLGVVSGYRSVDYQRNVFLSGLGQYSTTAIAQGRADAQVISRLRVSAPPGYSKHHSGYAVDLRDMPGGTMASFGTSAVGRWMAANDHRAAKNRGFVPSYPSGAGAQGPDPEPWEYVYVGPDAIRCGIWLAADNDPYSFAACRADSPIPSKYSSLGAAPACSVHR